MTSNAGNEGKSTSIEPAKTDPKALAGTSDQKTPNKHRHIDDAQQSISQQAFVDRIRKSDRWMIALTAVIAFGGAASAGIFWLQLSAMQGQLDEMRDAQRPWISYYAVPDSPLVFGSRVKDGAPFVGLTLKTTFTNVGHLPAQFVYSAAALLPWVTSAQPIQRRDSFCRLLKERAITPEAVGYILLPNESTNIPHSVEMTGDDLSDWKQMANSTLAIAGCVDYVFGNNKVHHKVGFIFELDRNGKPPYPTARIEPTGGNVPQADLRLFGNPRLPWDID